LVLLTGVACLSAQVTWAQQGAGPAPEAPAETGERGLPVTDAALPAQPVGALAGQELRPMGDLGGAAQAIVGSLLGGKKGSKTDIVRVRVVEDSAKQLKLLVSTREGAGGSIYGRVRDPQARVQSQIATYRYEIPAGASDQELVFQLAENVTATSVIESGSLVLYLARAGGSLNSPDAVRTYHLPKTWMKPIEIQLLPMGAAAMLPATRGVDPLPEPPAQQVPAPQAGVTTRGAEGGPTRVWVGDGPPPVQERASAATGTPISDARMRAQIAALPMRIGTPATPAPPVDRNAKGPGSVTLGLLDAIQPSIDTFKASDMTSIWGWVYQDQNPASGVYYYLPRRYDLAWDPTNGHHLRVDYKAADAESGGGVVMAATLRSGVDSTDIELMRRLLQAHPNAAGRTVKLQPLPPGSTPQMALGSVWGAPADRIAASDLTENMQIAWATTAVDIENLRVALRGSGIQGTFSVPIAASGVSMEGPVSVGLASPATFGRMPWSRAPWPNPTPYPLRLRYVHALAIVAGKATVYSWNAGGVRVPPGAQVTWFADKVPAWLDSGGPNAALRMWIDYEVDSDCDACDKVALEPITGGASQTSAQDIVFHTLSLLSRTGAARAKLQVRSSFLDPRSRELEEMPTFTLGADDKNFKAPMQIYQPEGGTGGAPLFEYRLTLIMPDGVKYEGSTWIPVDALSDEYEISAEDARRSLGFLPPVPTEASGAVQ
jgi:hypothetical protein